MILIRILRTAGIALCVIIGMQDTQLDYRIELTPSIDFYNEGDLFWHNAKLDLSRIDDLR